MLLYLLLIKVIFYYNFVTCNSLLPNTVPIYYKPTLVINIIYDWQDHRYMDHHWVSDGSGRRHRITVIMESRRNGPQLSSRHDDDDDHRYMPRQYDWYVYLSVVV